MKKLTSGIVQFLHSAGFAVVSTIDEKGFPHNSCKSIVKIDPVGRIYLLDLYKAETFKNLQRNPHLSLTVVDEHRFMGYCLKGKVKLITGDKISLELIEAWENKLTSRLTMRVLKNIREEKKHSRHPEALLPKPEYIIEMDVEEIVDLTPHHIKEGA